MIVSFIQKNYDEYCQAFATMIIIRAEIKTISIEAQCRRRRRTKLNPFGLKKPVRGELHPCMIVMICCTYLCVFVLISTLKAIRKNWNNIIRWKCSCVCVWCCFHLKKMPELRVGAMVESALYSGYEWKYDVFRSSCYAKLALLTTLLHNNPWLLNISS